MQFVPYLNFDGNCAEAMAFYAKLFGGQIVFQSTFGEMPPGEGMPPLPESAKSRLMHAQLQVGAQTLMASDALPAMPGATAERVAWPTLDRPRNECMIPHTVPNRPT